MNRTLFLICFICFSSVLFAQEKLVKIIPKADILINEKKKGVKTYLSVEYEGFTEARLFQLTDSTYALEIFYEKEDTLFKARKYLSQVEVNEYREKLYKQYFYGYSEKEFVL